LNSSIRGAAGMSLGIATFPLASQKVLGANERVNMALIGCGRRGQYVARGMIENGVEIIYLCDLHPDRLEQASQFIADIQKRKPKNVKDMRVVLDDKNVDAVIIGTPDHWHALAAIRACQAGKDVFVEKPHAHNIWESRKMIEAARKYNRIVQVGTQNRSAPYIFEALEYIKSGKIGAIHLVKVYNLKPPQPFKPFHLGKTGEPPNGFSWDAWLGPAPYRPYYKSIFEDGWHHFWDFSGGDIINDGTHQVDLARMLMGNPPMPKAVSCSGGKLHFKDDDSEMPDLQIVTYEFDNFVMTLDHGSYTSYMRKTTGTIRRNDLLPYWTQNATRIELYGSDLLMIVGRMGGGWVAMTAGGKVVEKRYGRFPDPYHQKNFIESVKSRKLPNADIETLHPSCCMMHMANIAYRLGNKKLRFDSKTERFVSNNKANKLIKREYRQKYQVPTQV